MNKLFTAASAATFLAVFGVSAVSAADVDFYGSVRFGADMDDPDTAADSQWNIGTRGFGSRFGVRASTELGNGAAAGVHQEVRTPGTGDSSEVSGAASNVWISGGWGKLTLGEQGNPFTNAAKWDQSNFLGRSHGVYDLIDADSRIHAIRYDMSSGPFNLAVAAQGAGGDTDDDAVDGVIISVGYNFGVVDLDVAHWTSNEDGSVISTLTSVERDITSGTGTTADPYDLGDVTTTTTTITPPVYDYTAVGINGVAGPVDWYLAYQTASDNDPVNPIDITTIGGFVSFSVSENDKLYLEYVTHDVDTSDLSPTETILGYSHAFGGGASFIAEYRSLGDNTADTSPSKLRLAMKVDF